MIESSVTKVQTAFRLNKDLIHRLKMKAKKENRSLNNYVETVLMDIAYNEPNDETIAAIEEARSGKPMDKLDNYEEIPPQVQYFVVFGSPSGQIVKIGSLSAFFLFMSSGARSVWCDPFFEKGTAIRQGSR